jgi:hypothetical protein
MERREQVAQFTAAGGQFCRAALRGRKGRIRYLTPSFVKLLTLSPISPRNVVTSSLRLDL